MADSADARSAAELLHGSVDLINGAGKVHVQLDVVERLYLFMGHYTMVQKAAEKIRRTLPRGVSLKLYRTGKKLSLMCIEVEGQNAADIAKAYRQVAALKSEMTRLMLLTA